MGKIEVGARRRGGGGQLSAGRAQGAKTVGEKWASWGGGRHLKLPVMAEMDGITTVKGGGVARRASRLTLTDMGVNAPPRGNGGNVVMTRGVDLTSTGVRKEQPNNMLSDINHSHFHHCA